MAMPGYDWQRLRRPFGELGVFQWKKSQLYLGFLAALGHDIDLASDNEEEVEAEEKVNKDEEWGMDDEPPAQAPKIRAVSMSVRRLVLENSTSGGMRHSINGRPQSRDGPPKKRDYDEDRGDSGDDTVNGSMDLSAAKEIAWIPEPNLRMLSVRALQDLKRDLTRLHKQASRELAKVLDKRERVRLDAEMFHRQIQRMVDQAQKERERANMIQQASEKRGIVAFKSLVSGIRKSQSTPIKGVKRNSSQYLNT